MTLGDRQPENWVADSWGAFNVFTSVPYDSYRCVLALSSALMLSKDPGFHGDNTGSNPVGDANKESTRYGRFR